jgi:hypothetical protein
MKKISEHAQVAKLLKKKAKELGINVTSSRSKSFAGGDSVYLHFDSGSDNAVSQLKDYSHQFKQGRFNGMEDIYEYSNNRDDVPQTKYLFLQDDRAEGILGQLLHHENQYIANGENVTFSQFMYRLKDQTDDWQQVLRDLSDAKQHRDFEILFT